MIKINRMHIILKQTKTLFKSQTINLKTQPNKNQTPNLQTPHRMQNPMSPNNQNQILLPNPLDHNPIQIQIPIHHPNNLTNITKQQNPTNLPKIPFPLHIKIPKRIDRIQTFQPPPPIHIINLFFHRI